MGALLPQSPGACVLHLSGGCAEQGRQILQLPVLVLFQQYRAHQTGDRLVVGEDADDAGAAFVSSLTRSSRLALQTFFQ